MKIVIADDEKIIRLTLISMLEEIKINNCNIFQCSNGKELVEVVKNIRPDVVFVDIKMPLLNGLEAIEECKSTSKNSKFIITTGFSEFQYAKKSIELGVYEYLLKPIEPSKLKELINNILKEKEEKLYEDNVKFQSNMIELFYDDCFINEERFNKLYSNRYFTVCKLYLDSNLDNTKIIEVKRNLLNIEEPIINEMIHEDINMAKLNTDYESTVFIFSSFDENLCKINKYINKFVEGYKNSNNNLYITTVIGDKFQEIKKVRCEVEELKKYGSLRVVFGMEKNYSLKDLRQYKNVEKLQVISYIIDNISESYKNNIYIQFSDYLEKLERVLVNEKNILVDNKVNDNINMFFKRTINLQWEDKASWKWMTELYGYKEKILKGCNKNKDVTEQIMEFINQNYMYEISITNLSEIFDLSPNYISSLFHKKTNMKLTDYIGKVRINKSKKLLAETDLNVDDISEAVGYHSTRHYAKLFKTITGISPSEYRKNLYK